MRGVPSDPIKYTALIERRRQIAKEQGLGTKITNKGCKKKPSHRKGISNLDLFWSGRSL